MERQNSIGETSRRAPDEIQLSLDGLTAYINAGGRGTRLNPLFEPNPRTGISKALLPVGAPPLRLIDHHINKLADAGIQLIVAGVGDHEHVADYVASNRSYRAEVRVATADRQYGNGGDLVKALHADSSLFGRHVLINNVDTILDLDEEKLALTHLSHPGEATIALTTQAGVPNENAFYVAEYGQVLFNREATVNPMTESDAALAADYRASSTGTLVLERGAIEGIQWDESSGPLSLYRDIVSTVLERSGLFAYNNGERLFTDVGTVPSWEEAQEHTYEIQPYLHY